MGWFQVGTLNNQLAGAVAAGFDVGMVSRRIPAAPPGAAPRAFELYDERMLVRRYRLLLFLKRRVSGARQAVAEALGHTRSFVTLDDPEVKADEYRMRAA